MVSILGWTALALACRVSRALWLRLRAITEVTGT